MDHSEFGRYLVQQRELRGMERDEVSAQTRIPRSILTALEQGQVERLPERVFVLHYIRAYANVIGLSPEEAVLRYQEIGAPVGAEAQAQAGQKRGRRRKGFWIWAALGAALAAGTGALVLWQHGLG